MWRGSFQLSIILSGGRAAWNIVTSAHDNEAQNYGETNHLDHALKI